MGISSTNGEFFSTPRFKWASTSRHRIQRWNRQGSADAALPVGFAASLQTAVGMKKKGQLGVDRKTEAGTLLSPWFGDLGIAGTDGKRVMSGLRYLRYDRRWLVGFSSIDGSKGANGWMVRFLLTSVNVALVQDGLTLAPESMLSWLPFDSTPVFSGKL